MHSYFKFARAVSGWCNKSFRFCQINTTTPPVVGVLPGVEPDESFVPGPLPLLSEGEALFCY